MSEFKCAKCGGEVLNKNYHSSSSESVHTPCANNDYERGIMLEKDSRSVKNLSEAALLFRILDDFCDASSHAEQCEDRVYALQKKRQLIALLICSCITVVIYIIKNFPL